MTIDEILKYVYSKGETLTTSEIIAMLNSAVAGYLGDADPATNPAIIEGANAPGKWFSYDVGGVYAHFLGIDGQPITIVAPPEGSLIFNGRLVNKGAYWEASGIVKAIPTQDVSGKANQADFLPVKAVVDFLKLVLIQAAASGWAVPVIDANERLYGGFKSDGTWLAFDYALKSIAGAALKDGEITLDKLAEAVRGKLFGEVDAASGWAIPFMDKTERLYGGFKTNGKFVAFDFDYTINDDSIGPEKLVAELREKIDRGGVSNLIIMWGNSLTAQGDTTSIINLLAAKWGDRFTYKNGGVGGEKVGTIAARQGGIPAIIIPAFTLPASNTESVIISPQTPIQIKNSKYGAGVEFLRQTSNMDTVNPCWVQGIQCTIAWVDETAEGAADGKWTLKRVTSAPEPTNIPANSPIITNGAKKFRSPYMAIFWIAQNGGYLTDAALVDYYKQMIAYSGTDRFLVIGEHTGGTSREPLEKLLFDEFGHKFLNWRIEAVNYALKNLGINPTEADNTAMANGQCPPSLLSDAVHLNENGRTALADLIDERAQQLEYI